MDGYAVSRRLLGRYALCLGLGAAALTLAGQATAGCGNFTAPGAMPPSWIPTTAAAQTKLFERTGQVRREGIVGLWKFTFVSDGTAYPAQIPSGAVVDFGTAIWHSDGTEITFSAGRPPSSSG